MNAVVQRTDHTATADNIRMAEMLASYARVAAGTAYARQTRNDAYGHTLAASRAQVYAQAGELARIMDLSDAAQEMMRRAQATHVRLPPLIDFDPAGIQYVAARAWQFCAWQIDPPALDRTRLALTNHHGLPSRIGPLSGVVSPAITA